jgi:hypothetical protein
MLLAIFWGGLSNISQEMVSMNAPRTMRTE